MTFPDLRAFIAEAENLNAVTVVKGADWELEIELITAWQITQPDNPLLLFKEIKGYAPEYAVATNLFGTPARTALALGMPYDLNKMEIVFVGVAKGPQFEDAAECHLHVLGDVQVAESDIDPELGRIIMRAKGGHKRRPGAYQSPAVHVARRMRPDLSGECYCAVKR